MSITKFRAWLFGAAIIILVYAIWFIVLQLNLYSEVLVFILWACPFFGALITAYKAPQNKILLGISLSVVSALLAIFINFITQSRGISVDFPGVKGGVTLLSITLLYSVILCVLGSYVGKFLAHRLARRLG